MTYWDTSALFKLYVPEPDSDYFSDLVAKTDGPILSSNVIEIEMLCAFHRREQAGDLKSEPAELLFERFLADLSANRIVTVPYGPDGVAKSRPLVKLAYQQVPPLMIRSLDVIHLASALVSHMKTLVTTDPRLRELAGLTGLKVIPHGEQ